MTPTTMLLAIKPQVVLIIVGAIALLTMFVVLAHRAEQKRRRTIFTLLRERGFTVTEAPAKPAKAALFASFEGITALRHGGKGLRWHAVLKDRTRHIEVIEHSYTISSGKNSSTIVHLCIAMVGGAAWPMLTLTPEGIADRLGELLGGKADIKLENERFNKAWRVRCDDDAFALAILSPEVQQVLAESVRGESWSFGGPTGLIWTARTVSAQEKTVREMFERLEAVVAAIPPEARGGLGLIA